MSVEYDRPSDADLVARLGADDASALDHLLERYWAPLVGYVARITGSPEAAQDVAQDVFCRLWERRGSWEREGSVRGLLFRLARNAMISEHRRERARARAAESFGELMIPAEVSSAADDDGALRTALEQAIAALPARRREVFVLRVLHELSYREIAAVMGISTQTVANQLSHALATLRAQLEHLLE